jgi:hypothetical protein
MQLACAGYTNTKEEVRIASHALILEFYVILGKKELFNYLSQMRKPQIEHLQKAFD